MKANHNKYHLFLSTQDKASIQIVNVNVKNSSAKNILEATVENNFKFDMHMENFCKKANIKLNTFARLVNYMDLLKRRTLMNAFFRYEYNCCPVIWMSHRRLLNDRINKMYEGYLRIIYSYKKSYFEELLNKDNFASIRHKKIETLGVQVCKWDITRNNK